MEHTFYLLPWLLTFNEASLNVVSNTFVFVFCFVLFCAICNGQLFK